MSLSVLRDSVPESNAAMLILVDLDGEVAVDITVTVQTRMGTGRHCSHCMYLHCTSYSLAFKYICSHRRGRLQRSVSGDHIQC